ncbi:beta-ketoacyl-ACP synthase II [Weissella tructae]|uniref:3-oxoacyl-[acyl-carrier-protein] synthase 2 n=1 Tax=Weissella tructae TaxID=887702 RepID=A0ABM5QRM1_9LACO|nr:MULTISPECIES: beta-ketoacyl-ACP synthase II [Weissella]AIG65503.1 3-oxoacyl-[acyl-carrier-protein] synthase 2 [Weissella tructae]ELA07038.1 3-oxoacyl-[acyl-carrier protein] synthase II [Weissella ceti NC36]QVV91956.1 beta-ketoacyl-ACP synthase II [Weissella tructae]
MTRVVVTGMGALTPLGHTTTDYLENLFNGISGLAPITKFDASETGITVAGEVKDFDPSERVGKREARKMDVFAQYGIHATGEALEQAQLDLTDDAIDARRVGVIMGNGIGGLTTIEDQVIKLHDKGPARVSPLFVPNAIPNMLSGNISIRYGAQGVNYVLSTACASATNAIGEAFWRIKDGRADVMITGGAEATVNAMGISGFAALTALSTSTDPAASSRPFDANRDGFVMGEGAGTLILESLEHAQARGAHILAEIVGYGANSDAFHLTSPTPDGSGPAEAMQLALADANVPAQAIDYMNAHGTGTHANDLAESNALVRVFGPQGVAVSSTKGMTGHLLGAAGAIEAIAAIGSLLRGQYPANVGLTTKDPEINDIDLITETQDAPDVQYTMSANYGFGGHNAALVFKKWEA